MNIWLIDSFNYMTERKVWRVTDITRKELCVSVFHQNQNENDNLIILKSHALRTITTVAVMLFRLFEINHKMTFSHGWHRFVFFRLLHSFIYLSFIKSKHRKKISERDKWNFPLVSVLIVLIDLLSFFLCEENIFADVLLTSLHDSE